MTSSEKDIVGIGSFGSPTALSEEQTMKFQIHDFASLEKKRYKTSSVVCHGYQWRLMFYPWGDKKKGAQDEFVSIYLCFDKISEAPFTNFTIRVPGVRTLEAKRPKSAGHAFGWTDFAKRSDLLNKLDQQGTLIVYVDLQVEKDKVQQWRPQESLQRNLLGLYESETSVDVAFELNNDIVRTHRLVLLGQCPSLYEIVSNVADGENIPIENADSDLFEIMVRFMYCDKLPEDFDLKASGLELLKLANRFGYSNLKIHLEAELVESSFVCVENAAEILLFADSHCCALLKEAAMALVAKNPSQITETQGWKSLKESCDLLAEVYEQAPGARDCNTENVSQLRKRLSDYGLDVDGTIEMMVNRLKTSEDGESDDKSVEGSDDQSEDE